MALESEFKNNAKLRDCARYNKDHIGEHYAPVGDWVILIKKALNAWVRRRQSINQIVPGMIVLPETNKFDKQTGDLVEIYKKHHKILNYAGKIDRIVGINTVWFLDKELLNSPPLPPSGVRPPLPPLPDSDPENDPNVIFAGNRFRFKFLNSVSMGAVAGWFNYEFAVWDIDNNRAAAYRYEGAILTAGIPPISESGEGSWSEVITTKKPVRVDQFNGAGDHSNSGPIGRFRLSFAGPFVETGLTVLFPITLSKSISGETGNGTINLATGSVQVFKGD